jgi:hypothetical protein
MEKVLSQLKNVKTLAIEADFAKMTTIGDY